MLGSLIGLEHILTKKGNNMTWENFRGFVPMRVVEQAVHFCESTECLDCPIYINNIDHRTQYEKEVEHIPCVDNLVFELVNGRTLN